MMSTITFSGLNGLQAPGPTWYDSMGRHAAKRLDSAFLRVGSRVSFSARHSHLWTSDHVLVAISLTSSPVSPEERKAHQLAAALQSPYLPAVLFCISCTPLEEGALEGFLEDTWDWWRDWLLTLVWASHRSWHHTGVSGAMGVRRCQCKYELGYVSFHLVMICQEVSLEFWVVVM